MEAVNESCGLRQFRISKADIRSLAAHLSNLSETRLS